MSDYQAKFVVVTKVSEVAIWQDTFFHGADGVQQQMFSNLLKIQEQEVKNALVKMGWTPPGTQPNPFHKQAMLHGLGPALKELLIAAAEELEWRARGGGSTSGWFCNACRTGAKFKDHDGLKHTEECKVQKLRNAAALIP